MQRETMSSLSGSSLSGSSLTSRIHTQRGPVRSAGGCAGDQLGGGYQRRTSSNHSSVLKWDSSLRYAASTGRLARPSTSNTTKKYWAASAASAASGSEKESTRQISGLRSSPWRGTCALASSCDSRGVSSSMGSSLPAVQAASNYVTNPSNSRRRHLVIEMVGGLAACIVIYSAV